MTALSIQPTYPIFTDIDGQPLEAGYIWIGTANLNPITNPISVYWDAALTLPAAQPIRTVGGYPVNAGTPARLYVNSDYSIQVQNRNGSVVYSAPAATERYNDIVVTNIDSANVSFLQAGTGSNRTAVARTVQSKLRDVVSVKDFGAVGDGVADDTAAIQAAINFAIYGVSGNFVTNSLAASTSSRVVRFPTGTYKTTDTIHVGYGTSFTTCILEGDFAQFYTGIAPTFNDRPAIAVQGTRRAIIRGLNIVGLNASFIQSQLSGGFTDRSQIAQWAGPNLGATSLARYAPYAGIAIDPYSGPQPGVSYPAVSYPSFLGATSQYNKNFSNQVIIEDCAITGFAVGLAVQPCDADGNGDFVSLRNCDLSSNIYCIAIGNSQARQQHRINVMGNKSYTFLDTVTFGKQIGNAAGITSGCTFDENYQILNIKAGFLDQPLVFENCYAEGLYWIGTTTLGAGGDRPIEFNSCALHFYALFAQEFSPRRLMQAATQQVRLVNSTLLSRTPAVFCVGSKNVSIDNCYIDTNTAFDTSTIGGKVASTLSLGIWDDYTIGNGTRLMDVGSIRNESKFNFAGSQLTASQFQVIDCDLVNIEIFNNMPIPLWAKQIGTRNAADNFEFGVTSLFSGIASISKSGREYTCTVNVPFTLSRLTISPGSIVLADISNNQQLFYIKSVTNFTATTFDAVFVQLTDVKFSGGVWSVKSGSDLVSSNLYIYNASKFYPCTVPVWAETTSGSATVTLRVCGDNTAGATSVGTLAANDGWDGGFRGYGVAQSSLKSSVLDASISVVTAGSGQLTMAANARFSGQFQYPIFLKASY